MKHAVLGASSAHRWRACPGSVREIAKLPPSMRNTSSDHAREGNAAHSLGERRLIGEYIEDGWISPEGKISPTRKEGFFPITEEMVEAVKVYEAEVVYHLDRLSAPELLVEQTVEPLPERDDIFGTADAIIIEPYGELIVLDFKYGVGHVVEPKWNDQALMYALGALNRIGDDASVESVTIVIVQPRAHHLDGPVRRWTVDPSVIRAEADQLRSAVRATEDPDAPLVPGESQCKWCPAAGRCPALRQIAMTQAVTDFETTPTIQWPDPDDGAAIGRGLRLAALLETFIDGMPRLALAAAQRGVDIPGMKLVRGTKHRIFPDESKVLRELQRTNILPEAYMTAPELKSPAQLEKVMGKEWTAQFAIKPEGAIQLVPVTDRRQAVQPQLLAEFEDLTKKEG